jgi:hypothetical protein
VYRPGRLSRAEQLELHLLALFERYLLPFFLCHLWFSVALIIASRLDKQCLQLEICILFSVLGAP